MPIAATDIDFHFSGSGQQSDPDASLGGAIAAEQLVDAALHNLFDVVSSAESLAGDTEYRCIYVKNNHGSLTLQSTVIWIQTQTPSTDTVIAIGIGTSAINGTEQTIADEDTAPNTVVFTEPADEGGALSIGDIPFGEHQAIWIRRIVSATASAYNNDSVVLRVKGDTGA